MEAAMEYVFFWLFFAMVTGVIGSRKGEGFMAFLVGLLFGPFGVIFAIVSSGNRMPCPCCCTKINKHAKVCPQCHSGVHLERGRLVESRRATHEVAGVH
jgi:hypothetical protein